MNIIIKKIISRVTLSSFLLSSSILFGSIILLFDWKNKSWLESILVLLILTIFLFYRKQAAANETHLHALLDNVSDAILTIDAKGSVLSVNNAVEHMFGYRPAELLTKNIKILMPSPYNEMHDSYLLNYEKTGQQHIIGKTSEVKA
ncbi:MAG: PAS domain S-box protein, partial [Methylomarinum sp.]|nr:PAS domain S-box protein [Methylomarinum sp.]